jgi:hypothetical protein
MVRAGYSGSVVWPVECRGTALHVPRLGHTTVARQLLLAHRPWGGCRRVLVRVHSRTLAASAHAPHDTQQHTHTHTQAEDEGCLRSGLQTAGILGAAGIPVGFFRAHVVLKVRGAREHERVQRSWVC